MSTHNIRFGWEIKKSFFCFTLLTKDLDPDDQDLYCFSSIPRIQISKQILETRSWFSTLEKQNIDLDRLAPVLKTIFINESYL